MPSTKAQTKSKCDGRNPVINEALLECCGTIETVNGVGLPSNASIASFATVSGTVAAKDLVIELTQSRYTMLY
jgi:hypothetical protein